jgi:hypothetical protein
VTDLINGASENKIAISGIIRSSEAPDTAAIRAEVSAPPILAPDRHQIETFTRVIFRHAALTGYVSLRSFHDSAGTTVFSITTIPLGRGLEAVIEEAVDEAHRAANAPMPVVFCPPLSVFDNREHARAQDISQGLVLSVECDQHPQHAREILESILGPATVVVKSGGLWVNGGGIAEPKLHLHWRLKVPAADPAALKKLTDARDIAAKLVGGDASNKPICHPIRWPGSWHRKAEPRLCQTETLNADVEIDLDEALAKLKAAAPPPSGATSSGPDEQPESEGKSWSELADNIIKGNELHYSIAALAMKMLRAGMSDGAAVNLLRGLMNASTALRNERWKARFDDIPRAVSTARAKLDAEQQASNNNNIVIHWHGEVDPVENRPFLIQDLVPKVGKGLISGQWGTYKTFTAIALALAVMTGTKFLGYEVVRRGGVLFIALEGQSEVAIRLQGAIDNSDIGGLDRAPFAWIDDCPPLLGPNAADELIRIARKAAARMQADFGLELAMIQIDTMILAAGYSKDGAENDAALGSTVMAVLGKVASSLECFVFAVDHFGKDPKTGTRGTSVKETNADVIFALLADKAITGEVTNTKLAVRKIRSGANGREFPFTPRVIEIETGGPHVTASTLVLDWGPTDQPHRRPDQDWGNTDGVNDLRKVIMENLADLGTELQPFADGPAVRALKVDLVRAEFFKVHLVTTKRDTPDAKRRAKAEAFTRAIKAAKKKGVITTREVGEQDWIWLSRPHPQETHARGGHGGED